MFGYDDAILAGTSVLGGVVNLLGDSEEEKRNQERRKRAKAMLQQMDRNKQLAQEEKNSNNREFASAITDRKNSMNQKLAQYGFDPVGSIASNEKDLVTGNIETNAAVDLKTNKVNNDIQSTIDQINAGMEEPESGISRFGGGLLKGFNLGSDVNNALGLNSGESGGEEETTGIDKKKTSTVDGDYMSYIQGIRKKKLQLNRQGNISLLDENQYSY